MRISTLIVACGAVAALISNAAIAQTGNDATASQPAVAVTKSALRAQNRQLSKAVRRALYATKGLTASNIEVLAKGGTVSLLGTVPVESQISMAGDAVKRVPHVKVVDNRLTVAVEGGGE
ncbi:hypothetical protein C2L64_45725 [Paraburkholderia hospita]|jgi:osmotically-inducible protein OsmY|uniref:BON domain-containing protein n=1 Tax=Paraburkholderia hospita TaxID=169430 RepID=A0AAN1MQR7_9BURK|nr:BON domain-containing protein [Paraburkholderia hospita]AUT75656.1 hypothetical protein C2L64_45725 [Paraburkholderia hospita]